MSVSVGLMGTLFMGEELRFGVHGGSSTDVSVLAANKAAGTNLDSVSRLEKLMASRIEDCVVVAVVVVAVVVLGSVMVWDAMVIGWCYTEQARTISVGRRR